MDKERLKVLELFAGAKVKVSNTGDVFSLDHLNKKRDGRTDNRRGRKLKTVLRKGYPAITISHDGARKTFAVHRLVATAFLPNPLGKQTVNHKNGIKTDNRVENLEWATYKENCIHREKNGLGNNNRDKLGRYMNKLKVLELFSGIGACSKALTNLGIPHEIVDAVEVDEWAVKSFNAIHGTNFPPQDITKWDKDVECDLIMHGSPCQDFSNAGKQAGGDEGSGTRSSLMYETIRIVEKLRPKYVIWENVANLLGQKHVHNFGEYLHRMRKLGYLSLYKIMNAKDYGVPQNRKRVFVVSVYLPEQAKNAGGDDLRSLGIFDFPEPIPLKKHLCDVLDSEVDEKYYLTPEQAAKIKFCAPSKDVSKTIRTGGRGSLDKHAWDLVQVAQIYGFGKEPNPQAGRVYDANGICPTLDTMSGGNRMPKIIDPQGRTKKINIPKDYAPTLRAQSHGNEPCVVEDGNPRIRKLTAKECWRLMGFSDDDFEKAASTGVSNTQLYKQAGNSICVNVLEAIFKNLL